MTHVTDLGPDLDDLLGRLADDFSGHLAGRSNADLAEETVDDRGPLVRPMAGLTSPVWYA